MFTTLLTLPLVGYWLQFSTPIGRYWLNVLDTGSCALIPTFVWPQPPQCTWFIIYHMLIKHYDTLVWSTKFCKEGRCCLWRSKENWELESWSWYWWSRLVEHHPTHTCRVHCLMMVCGWFLDVGHITLHTLNSPTYRFMALDWR